MTSGVGRRPTRRAPLRPRLRMTGATGVIAGPEAGGTSSGSGGSVAGPGADATGSVAMSPPADGKSPAGTSDPTADPVAAVVVAASVVSATAPAAAAAASGRWPGPPAGSVGPGVDTSSLDEAGDRCRAGRRAGDRRSRDLRGNEGRPGRARAAPAPRRARGPDEARAIDVTGIQADESLLGRRQRRRRGRRGAAVRAVRPGPDRRATVGRPGLGGPGLACRQRGTGRRDAVPAGRGRRPARPSDRPTHLRRRRRGGDPSRRSRAPAARRSRRG